MLGYKIGYIYGYITIFILGTEYGIKLGINERTNMGYLISSSERSKYGKLNGSLGGILLRFDHL